MKGAERIYVYPEFTHSCTERGKGDVEYIRADIVEEMREALEGLVEYVSRDHAGVGLADLHKKGIYALKRLGYTQ